MYGVPLVFSKISSTQQTVTVSGIPNSYKHLIIIWTARTTDTIHGPQTRWTWNDTQVSNGANWAAFGAESGVTFAASYGPEGDFRQRAITRDEFPEGSFCIYRAVVPNYSTTSVTKAILTSTTQLWAGPTNAPSALIMANCLNTTSTLSSIKFGTNQGPYKTGSLFAVYGVS
jgi:hypothetical protein